jgi:orotidine-5'-phosphate decarboxylase
VDLKDQPLGDGRPLYEALAGMVDDLGHAARATREPLSSLNIVGAVTGATRPDLLARLRELMPGAIFLLPGVGAQGGSVQDLAPAFANHPAGGLITASRSIVDAWRSRGGDPATAALAAAEELREAAWSLAS